MAHSTELNLWFEEFFFLLFLCFPFFSFYSFFLIYSTSKFVSLLFLFTLSSYFFLVPCICYVFRTAVNDYAIL